MVIQQGLDHLFGALADPTRREIITLLSRRTRSVGELSACFPISQPAITKHLNVLERAGLITREVDGRHRRCRLHPERLAATSEWIGRVRDYWMQRFDLLEEIIHKEELP